MEQYYVLFPNHEQGLKLHKELKKLGVGAQIAPTPRSLSKCCGISLMIEQKDVPVVEECVKQQQINILGIEHTRRDLNPDRDRYC